MLSNIKEARLSLHNLVVTAVVIIAALFLGSRLHSGHVMDEDFSVYLQQAANIIHGKPFHDMGVVYNVDPRADLRDQAPLTYPPAVPLLQAPVVELFGFNIEALKAAQLFLLIATFALMAGFRTRLGFSLFEVCAAIVVFSLLPETLWQINDIGSDLPFLFFLVVALIAVEAQLAAPPARRLGVSILVGIATFIAFDARAVAVAVLPAAALAHIVRDKKQTHIVNILVPGAVFAVCWLLQSKLLAQQSTYAFVFTHKFFDIIPNLKSFYWHMIGPWDGTRLSGVAIVIILAATVMAGLGVLDGLRRIQAAAWFCAVYLTMLLILPNFNAGLRYLIPVFLFFGAFAARGAGWTASMLRLKGVWIAVFPGVTVAALGVLLLFALSSVTPLTYGALTASTTEIFNFLDTHTSRDALVGARKYRAFHLFTQRRTIQPPIGAQKSGADFSSWAAENHVSYIVLKKSARLANNDYSDCPASPLCSQTVAGAEPVFQNADYQVFRLQK